MSTNAWKARALFAEYNVARTRDAQEVLERTEAYHKERLSQS